MTFISRQTSISFKYVRSGRLLACCVSLVIASPTAIAADVLVFNPQPFRLDERHARTFGYQDYSLLHRYSYLPSPYWRRNFNNGLIATVGSVTSEEFYSLFHFSHSIEATDNFSLKFRADRGEDFDSRYEKNLFGLSYRWENWEFSSYSALVADKSTDDLELNVKYYFDENSFLRGAIVAADAVANKKQNAIEYTRLPYTYFSEWGFDISPQWRWNGYINYNAPLTLIDLQSSEHFEYEKLTLQSDLYYQTGKNTFYWSVALEQSDKELFRTTSYSYFERNFTSYTFRLDRQLDYGGSFWLGLRRLKLMELDNQFSVMDSGSKLKRNEWIAFAGWRWMVGNNQFFSPNVYIDPLDNWQTFTDQPDKNTRDTQTLVKLSFPYEWQYDQHLTVILNATVEVDKSEFGGLNAQVNYQF